MWNFESKRWGLLRPALSSISSRRDNLPPHPFFYGTFSILRRLHTWRSWYVAENGCPARFARFASPQNPLPPFPPARLRHHVLYSGHFGRGPAGGGGLPLSSPPPHGRVRLD